MKREFLQNFKIGDQPLSKEIIDEIMAENGRDIEAAKKPFADYDTIKSQLDEAQKTISGFQGQDIETIKQSAKDWEKKYNDAVAESQRKIADMEFDHALDAAITGSRGRSTKAVRAMLDLDALKASKNQEADIKTALETLQKESGYLRWRWQPASLFQGCRHPAAGTQHRLGAGRPCGGSPGKIQHERMIFHYGNYSGRRKGRHGRQGRSAGH